MTVTFVDAEPCKYNDHDWEVISSKEVKTYVYERHNKCKVCGKECKTQQYKWFGFRDECEGDEMYI